MNDNLKEKLAPCGLHCEKCFAFIGGPIQKSAELLKANLGNFDNYAKRFSILLEEPKFNYYQEFKELLNLLATKNCKGCREQECELFKNCLVKLCINEKKIDFCYLCSDFPCENTGFDEDLHKRWMKINKRIIEIGLENYYNEIKDNPRY